jgi:hypothetical protein
MGIGPSLGEFFSRASLEDIPGLTHSELMYLDQQLKTAEGGEGWTKYANKYPEVFDALKEAILNEEVASAARRQSASGVSLAGSAGSRPVTGEEYKPMTEEEYDDLAGGYWKPDPKDDLSIPGFLRREPSSAQERFARPIPPSEVPRSEHPFSRMTSDFKDAYDHYIQPHIGDVRDFAKQYFGGYDTSRIEARTVEGGYLHLRGYLRDPDSGRSVAEVSRSIRPTEGGAYHGLLDINPDFQGTAGPRILRGQIDTYHAMGLDHVGVHAASSGGPGGHYGGAYAWAKYGFLPDQNSWNQIRRTMINNLDGGYVVPADRSYIPHIRNILMDPNPRAIWELSDVNTPTTDGYKYGKAALLNTLGWSGYLHLNDSASMERFNEFITRKPKKPEAGNP